MLLFTESTSLRSSSDEVIESVSSVGGADSCSALPGVDADVTSLTKQSTLPVANDGHRGLDIAPTSVIDQSGTLPCSSNQHDLEDAAPCSTSETAADNLAQSSMRVAKFYGPNCKRNIVKPSRYC